MRVIHGILIIVLSISSVACGNKEKASVTIGEEYTERYIRTSRASDFSIVLNDMNVDTQGDKLHFQHKYHILKVENDSLKVDSLDWKTVNEDFFKKHEANLGMEIVSNHDNNLSRIAKPVGFDWAVGNPKYGEWEAEHPKDSTHTNTDSSRRVWRPHTSGLFWYWMLRRPAYQRDYVSNKVYNASGRSYYGGTTNGATSYGTNSAYQKSKRSSFFTRKRSSSSWSTFRTRKSASSSRYDGGSTTRSRSGGFGK